MAAHIEHYVPQVARVRVALGRAVGAWLLALAGSLFFVSLVVAAPLLAARGHSLLSWSIYRLFAPLCHQIPERSFYLAGHPLAVCARCAGVYAGFVSCLFVYPLVRSLRRTDAPARAWLFAAALPTAVDFLINFTGVWHNTHLSRLLTGALLGAAAVFYVVPGLVELAQGRRRKTRAREGRPLADLSPRYE